MDDLQYGSQYGQPPQYAPPPPKRRRAWPWVLLGVVILLAVCGGIAIAALGGAAKSVHDSTTKTHTITYTISGTGAATISYSGDNFSLAQQSVTALPWSKTITVTGWQPVTINAQLEGTGTITCQIGVDGSKGAPVTSQGTAVIASCSADTFPSS